MTDHSNKFQKDKKISIEQMWNFIVKTLTPFDSVPDKTAMTDERILELYSIITEADEMFRMLKQIAELKKSIDELMRKS